MCRRCRDTNDELEDAPASGHVKRTAQEDFGDRWSRPGATPTTPAKTTASVAQPRRHPPGRPRGHAHLRCRLGQGATHPLPFDTLRQHRYDDATCMLCDRLELFKNRAHEVRRAPHGEAARAGRDAIPGSACPTQLAVCHDGDRRAYSIDLPEPSRSATPSTPCAQAPRQDHPAASRDAPRKTKLQTPTLTKTPKPHLPTCALHGLRLGMPITSLRRMRGPRQPSFGPRPTRSRGAILDGMARTTLLNREELRLDEPSRARR